MIFEDTTNTEQAGTNKPVISEDLSEAMIAAYREVGIFGSEEPVRQTTKRLMKLSPNMIFPPHGSCIDNSMHFTPTQ